MVVHWHRLTGPKLALSNHKGVVQVDDRRVDQRNLRKLVTKQSNEFVYDMITKGRGDKGNLTRIIGGGLKFSMSF